MLRVGIERIGIIAETGDGHAVLAYQIADVLRAIIVESRDVNMGDARIATIGVTGRPAHELHAVKAFARSERQNVCQHEIAQDGADKAELHDAFLPQRPTNIE